MKFDQVRKLEDGEEQNIQNQDFLLKSVLAEAEKIIVNLENRNKKGELLVFPDGPKSKLDEQNWKIVRTKSFKKWFGDWEELTNLDNVSKIVDKNGEPLLVYHATLNEIGPEGLKTPDYSGNDNQGKWKDGVLFFTSEPQVANYFVENKKMIEMEKLSESEPKDFSNQQNIYFFSSFLNIKKPIILNRMQEVEALFNKRYREIQGLDYFRKHKELSEIFTKQEMEQKGYDGFLQKKGDVSLNINIPVAKNRETPADILSDQYGVFSPEQILITPNTIALKENINKEIVLDQIRLFYDYIKSTIDFEHWSVSNRSIKLSALKYKFENIIFYIEKINKIISNNEFKSNQVELKRMLKNFENYKNHYDAFIAYYKKDKNKLFTCKSNSKFKIEQLEELYKKL